MLVSIGGTVPERLAFFPNRTEGPRFAPAG